MTRVQERWPEPSTCPVQDGLVLRRVVFASPPGVEYSLTERGVTLLPAIQQLADWALQNHAAIRQSRSRFDARQQATPGRTVHTLTPRRNVKLTA